jgi:hopanoid biosynthesis associated RND transporter like protein HpnN
MSGWLSLWVDWVRRGALWVAAAAVLSAALALSYTRDNLGINTDTGDMFSADLPWRRTYLDFADTFTQFSDLIIVVVDGDTPDLAERAARRIAVRLESQTELVQWVYRPGAGPFFERNALLYLDLPELQDLVDDLALMQPFLARLSADPTLAGLFDLSREALDEDQLNLDLTRTFERLSEGIEATLAGRFHELSWREIMLQKSPEPGERRRIIQVKPKLDYTELLPAGPVMARIRGLARELELDPAHGVRVRLTGTVPLYHEELDSVSRGMAIAAVAAFVMVALVLFAGLRSTRLVLACLATLVVGLCWTAAFAAAAVGSLNLISIAFAVLYIGLGVDSAIHFALRYQELARTGMAHAEALRTTASDVGGSLALCALTTGAGFFAFVPTDFSGVSELGLISGTGMFISLFASLTVLPALLTLAPVGVGARQPARARAWSLARRRRSVLAVAAVLGVVSLLALPGAGFDRNQLNMREAESESVSTFRDILEQSETTPWSSVVLVAGEAEAVALQERLAALAPVDATISLADFVPGNQDAKLDLVEELGVILGVQLESPRSVAPPSPARQRGAARALREALRGHEGDPAARALAGSLDRLLRALAASESSAASVLGALQQNLLGGLSDQLERLAASLEAQPVARNDLPEALIARWVAPGGRHRVEIYPREDIQDHASLERFVFAVREVAPNATDDPVTMLESGNAVVRAFQQAFATALVIIAGLLYALMRRPRDVAMVLGPLLLAGLLTVAVMVLLGLQFNYANVITLPLLLGIGVDNGIHMVHRARAAPPDVGSLLATSTTRAVFTSALTTICGFGSLAWSSHPGTASMGQVLSIGLGLTLLCTLVLLPALLDRD